MRLALIRVLLAAVLSLWLTTSAWAGLDEVLADALAEFWEDVVLVERNAIAEAQFILGTFYYDEQGVVPQDYVEAFKWFRKAAELEHVDAQFILGVMYFAGQGVPVDTVEAVKWVRMAAEQGNVDAQFTLGVMYFGGDDIQAHMWFNLAASNGHEKGRKKRDTMAELMTPADHSEAQRLAREWLDAHRE